MNESLKKYVKQITELPTVPVIAQEILRLVNDKLISVDRLEGIIQNDPAISAKVLSIANSVFFRVKEPTRTLNSAIIRIGFDSVKNVAVGVSLMSVFHEKQDGKAFDYQGIFNHSVTVGFIARQIAANLKMYISDEIVMNGMLHDLGFLVLNRYFSDHYKKVLKQMEAGETLLDAEREVLGFNHTEIGAWLAAEWNLPDSICDTIMYHHSPSRVKKNVKQTAIIHIADYLTSRNIVGPVRQDPQYPFEQSALDVLGVQEKDLKDMEEKLKHDFSPER